MCKLSLTTPYNVVSVLWRLFKYIGSCSVDRGDNVSTVGDSFSTVEVAQYSGGIASVLWGITSVLWRLFSTVGDNISTCGDNISTVGENISTVEGIQYSGGRILISACLVINNDEKISTFFVLRYEIFIWKFFENPSRFHAF